MSISMYTFIVLSTCKSIAMFNVPTRNTVRNHLLIKDSHLCFHLHLKSVKCLAHLEKISGPKAKNKCDF